MTRALMIQGTASHAGKSVLTAAFGCWLRAQGLRVAPFKAQNMSLNSFVTLTGEEIARSQAMQAEALGLEPVADMNPILLKPLDHGCQVIVQGRGIGVMSIHEYYAYKPHAWRAITAAYDRLAAGYDALVLEGAGSPVEINLKANDLVNMRMAAHADAAVVLVADIERGGVFAQIIGTWELLEADEREHVVGFVINKFRGDPSLLESGLAYVQQRTGRPVLGVLPFDARVQRAEEDSLGLIPAEEATGEVDVAVLRLPGISNFTDFAALARVPGLSVRYVARARPASPRPGRAPRNTHHVARPGLAACSTLRSGSEPSGFGPRGPVHSWSVWRVSDARTSDRGPGSCRGREARAEGLTAYSMWIRDSSPTKRSTESKPR